MKKPLVSVIVLTYNSVDTISQALDSVLAQRCNFDFEVIVGDDGSTDGTQRLLEDYAAANPNIRLRLAHKNQGLQANYYSCLEASRGEFVADCAGDDYWIGIDRLQRLVDALCVSDDIAFAHSCWRTLREPEAVEMHVSPACSRDVAAGEAVALLLAAAGAPAVHLSAAVYRKSMLMPDYIRHKDLFLDRRYACEDLQALVALAANGRAVYLPFESLVYRIGHESAVTSQRDYAKSAGFSIATARLRRRLQHMYDLDGDPDIDRAVGGIEHFALSQAVLGGDVALVRDIATHIYSRSHIPARTRVLAAAVSSAAGLCLVRATKRLLQKLRNRK